jgi:hypothetical protein
MPPIPKFLKNPLVWLGALVALGVLGAAAFFGLQYAQAAPPQPLAYNHSVHVQNGVQCIFCHPGAIRGQSATLPTRQKCLGCHNNMDTAGKPGLEAVADFLAKNQEIKWVPVAIQPDFVYFTHRPHTAAGLNCEQCHGDVSKMKVAEYQGDQNMGWCLSCHKQQPEEKRVKLTDCATCHK